MANASVYDYKRAYDALVYLGGEREQTLRAAIDSGDAYELAKALLMVTTGLKGYDPNEPRDPHSGEWTGGGAALAVHDVVASLRGLPDAWRGGAEVKRYLLFSPGRSFGRGLVDERGIVHTWNEDEGSHRQVAEVRGVNLDKAVKFVIKNDGGVVVYSTSLGSLSGDAVGRYIESVDPRLHFVKATKAAEYEAWDHGQ